MSTQRLDWLDAAKGGAILLVVFHHSLLWLEDADLVHPIYERINYLLKQARMPLFFLASGVAASFIHRAPGRDYAAFKLLPIAWIYLAWTVIHGFAFEGLAFAAPWSAGGLFGYLPAALAAPSHGLWFVFALGVMCAVALLVRALPPALVLGGALWMTLHNDFGLWPRRFPVFPDWIVHNIFDYSVFFFAGLYGARRIIAAAASPRTMAALLVAALAGFAALNLLALQSDTLYWRTQTLRAVGGAAIGLSAAVLVSRPPRIGAALAWFGQRSLGVFLGHGFFLVPFATLLPASIHGSARFGALMPLAATVVAVAGSTLLYLGLAKIGLKWIYILPKSAGRAVLERWPRAASGL